MRRLWHNLKDSNSPQPPLNGQHIGRHKTQTHGQHIGQGHYIQKQTLHKSRSTPKNNEVRFDTHPRNN